MKRKRPGRKHPQTQDRIKETSASQKSSFRYNFLEIISRKVTEIDFLHKPYFIYSLFLLAGYIFILNAWICDDSFITYRTIDNFYNGYGLTWNVSERVQVFTHPLWMILHTAFYFITREPYFLNLAVSFVCTFAALYLLAFKISKDYFSAAAAIILLLFSKSFVDYSSSGLENPLSYLLTVSILWIFFDHQRKNRLFLLSLLISLALLTRLDFILLFAPLIVFELKKSFSFKSIFIVILGFIPLILWELFAVIYYGFPLPNTYYAKAAIEYPGQVVLISQGISYFANSLSWDPVTLIFTFGIILLSIFLFTEKSKDSLKYLFAATGILLYFLYLIKIGGDFMTGRFFSVPVFIAALLYARMQLKNKNALSVFVIILGLVTGIVNYQKTPLFSSASYGSERTKDQENEETNPWWYYPFTDENGITDERAFWYSDLGFLKVIGNGLGRPDHENIRMAMASKESDYKTFLRASIGMFGYYAGPEKHIIDYHALADALLARLPNLDNPEPAWRPGHNERVMPMKYFETIDKDTNLIQDKKIHNFYDKLSIIIKEPVFSEGRFSEILKMNTGAYDDLIHKDYIKIEERKYYMSSADSVHLGKWINNKGVYYARKEKYGVANYYYRKALEYDSLNTTIFNNVIGTYLHLKRFDSAHAYAQPFIKKGQINEAVQSLFMVWAQHYGSRQMYDSAKAKIAEWLEYQPENDNALSNYGYYALMAGENETAEKYWQKAYRLNPRHPDHIYNLYQLYLNVFENLDSAGKYARMVLRQGGRIPQKELQLLKGYIN